LIDMAESDSNPAVRHRALTTLLEHSEKGLRQQPPPQTTAPEKKVDGSAVIAELRLLYEKALGPRPLAQIKPMPDSPVNDLPSEETVTPEQEQDDTQLMEREIESSVTSGGAEDTSDSCLDIEEGSIAKMGIQTIGVFYDFHGMPYS
jgi:hypothetical protein